ncbi:MAG TPA: FAD-binding protein, partial [Solirubrobacteraceae bacterium]|nr:FAD-binding protein [Solirubrobacteraceae bacterium]
MAAQDAMKWWGWGQDGVGFTHEDKPDFAPFMREVLGVDVTRPTGAPARWEDLDVPASDLPDGLGAALAEVVGAAHLSVDPLDRVVHARGKSLRDLVSQRRGEFSRIPDVVVRPGSEDEVAAVLGAALAADAVVIPFGGGTSISGSLEAPAGESRPVVSVELARL